MQHMANIQKETPIAPNDWANRVKDDAITKALLISGGEPSAATPFTMAPGADEQRTSMSALSRAKSGNSSSTNGQKMRGIGVASTAGATIISGGSASGTREK